MAGLAGSLSSRGLPIPEVVSRMLAAAPHRGISELTVTKGACTLGVVGAGPEASLHSGDGLAAAFVGRLDNGPELAAEADLAGDEVTPAAVVAALFGRLRDRAPARLRGAYAAVVTDGTTLWGFRDHVGFETLFCAERSGEVRMASEAKQVAAGLSTPREPDLDTLRRIFYVSVEEHIRRATARVLVGEDAVSLSGGIDSPAIAAFAAPTHVELSGRPLAALSSVYPQFPSSDESDYIREVASLLGLPLHTYVPEAQTLDRLQDWVGLFDGPWSIWSPFGAEERFSLAARLGFRTILTGNLAEQVMSMQ